jgi:hypothetical protein
LKKIVILHANCQGGVYRAALEKSLGSQEYAFFHFKNFAKEPIPTSLLEQASYFIYQHLGDQWNDLSSAELLRRVPSHCVSIQIPKLSFRSYWPTDCPKDPRFVVNDDYPAGLYPYGDSILTQAIEQFDSTEEALDYYASLEFAHHYDLDSILKSDLEYLGSEHNARDIDASSFIEASFRSVKLFETPNHPCDVLYQFVFDRICNFFPNCTPCTIRAYFDFYQLPIHPSVVSYYKLEFSDDRYNIFGCNVFARDYARGYLRGEPVHRSEIINAVNAVEFFMKNGAL